MIAGTPTPRQLPHRRPECTLRTNQRWSASYEPCSWFWPRGLQQLSLTSNRGATETTDILSRQHKHSNKHSTSIATLYQRTASLERSLARPRLAPRTTYPHCQKFCFHAYKTCSRSVHAHAPHAHARTHMLTLAPLCHRPGMAHPSANASRLMPLASPIAADTRM